MTPYFYIIPGIMTPLEDARTWDFQAQAYFHSLGFKAAGFNYSDGVLGGTLARASQGALVANDLIEALAVGFDINVVTHSNGAGIVMVALRDKRVRVSRLFMLAPAINADCEENGLNDATGFGQVKEVYLGVSPDDEVLGLPVASYGRLGKDGPENVSRDLRQILTIIEPAQRPCGHSDWIGRDYCANMRTIANRSGALND